MILLSHLLDLHTPVYGNSTGLILKSNKTLKNGDSCNTIEIGLSNHLGTHVDCPNHFYEDGLKITDYSKDFWQCSSVQVLRHDLRAGELCDNGHLDIAWDKSEKNTTAEMVVFVSGWYKRRREDIYWREPPGFIPETYFWLLQKFPFIRFFGFDLISLSSFAHREIGREAHKVFLNGKHPILPVEDMDLSSMETNDLNSILVSPLFIKGADAAPCTVWGNFI
jgi:arylformamidase